MPPRARHCSPHCKSNIGEGDAPQSVVQVGGGRKLELLNGLRVLRRPTVLVEMNAPSWQRLLPQDELSTQDPRYNTLGRYWASRSRYRRRGALGSSRKLVAGCSRRILARAHPAGEAVSALALIVRAPSSGHWKVIGDVRCDSLISAVRNECGFAQWECPCRELRGSKLISHCMPICMHATVQCSGSKRELKQPRTGL